MNPRPPSRWRAVRWIAASLGTVLLWTFWLGLTVLLGIQVWWLRASELAVPDFVLRRLEARLAEQDLRATFGRTLFDPTGRILIQDLELFSTNFSEPLITADYLYLQADPVLLYAGELRPVEVEIEGVTLLEPALFSASGRTRPVVDRLNATIDLADRQLDLRQFTARVGPIDLSAGGQIPLPRATTGGGGIDVLADFIAHRYPRLSAELSSRLSLAEAWDTPRVRLRFSSETESDLQAEVEFSTGRLPYAGAVTAELGNLRARTRLSLAPLPRELEVSVTADTLDVTSQARVREVQVRVAGALDSTARTFAPVSAEVVASRVDLERLDEPLAPVRLELTSAETPFTGHLGVGWFGMPQGADFVVSPGEATASIRLNGWINDAMVGTAADLTQPVLRQNLQLAKPVPFAAEVELGPDWQPRSAAARFDGEDVTARFLRFDETRAHVAWDGETVRATDIYLSRDDSVARGSYLMAVPSLDFRFLLTGQLQPNLLNTWFKDWWILTFENFDFSRNTPAADVDIQGRWGDRWAPHAFIAIDAINPAIRGVVLDEVQTVLFTRPQYLEGRSVEVRDGSGTASGRFAHRRNPFTGEEESLEYSATLSGLDLAKAADLLGDSGRAILAPFRLENPPDLEVSGVTRRPANPTGPGRSIQIAGRATGTVDVYDFPLADPEFVAEVDNDDVTIEPFVNFADGRASGVIHLTGPLDNRRLDFDLQLQNARLGSAVRTLEAYSARRRNAEPPETSAYMERAGEVRMNLSATASGPAQDLLQLQGNGQAELTGAGLGEVRLLGLLSQIITVSSIRFSHLETTFQIDGPRLVMPDVRLTGSSAAIDARGVYNLAQRGLDFSGNIYPFGESRSVLQLLDVITRPLSEAVQIRLTGTLDRPTWALVPSLLSSNPLNGTNAAPAAPTAPTPAPASPATPAQTESP